MVNRVILVGNLVRDTESVPTSGKAMSRMRIATNGQWNDADGNATESTEFHAIVCFGRLAEVCALYCSKGRRIYVEGKLRTREYEADGVRRFTTEIVADAVKLLQPRAGADDADAVATARIVEEGA